MDENKKDTAIHRVVMEGRQSLRVSGVEDVESFDDDTVVIYTVDGTMTVKGMDFRINKLSVEDGELEIDGDVDSILYSDSRKEEHGGFFGRIFISFNSVSSGVFPFASPILAETLKTCVSTAIASCPNATLATTLAVFLPTPPSFLKSSIFSGTFPP